MFCAILDGPEKLNQMTFHEVMEVMEGILLDDTIRPPEATNVKIDPRGEKPPPRRFPAQMRHAEGFRGGSIAQDQDEKIAHPEAAEDSCYSMLPSPSRFPPPKNAYTAIASAQK